MTDKKFIIVQSESTANILIAHGFKLLSNVCGTYTFVNDTNHNFNFSNFDMSKIRFTNQLYI